MSAVSNTPQNIAPVVDVPPVQGRHAASDQLIRTYTNLAEMYERDESRYNSKVKRLNCVALAIAVLAVANLVVWGVAIGDALGLSDYDNRIVKVTCPLVNVFVVMSIILLGSSTRKHQSSARAAHHAAWHARADAASLREQNEELDALERQVANAQRRVEPLNAQRMLETGEGEQIV